MNVSAKNAQLAAAAENDLRSAVNEEIRFAIGECSLGSVLIAQSERGICAILLGDDHAASYGNIAKHIGLPGSAKDIGEACAANALAVAIPCHRVVKKDGELAGYR